MKKKLDLHPQQPMVVDKEGTVRFRGNAIVRTLLDTGKLNLNDLASMPFSQEDHIQLAQLIGYSVDGFGELSYVPLDLARSCDSQAEGLAKLAHFREGKKR